MLICIDIGNTNITMGGYKNDKLEFTARLATDHHRTTDQYAIEIRDILSLYNIDKNDISAAAICSVVPIVSAAVETAITKLFGITPMVLGPGIKTGLNIKIDNPSQLGADLVAGAVGAMAKCSCPAIVIDLGTATTISVIDQNGEFLGGAIAAGIKLTLEALASKTAQLPMVNIKAPKSVIGTNTADSMASGLIIGAAAMIDGMIDRIESELGAKASILATGGLAYEVVKHCNHEIALDDNLLLEGLKIIYYKNK